MAAGSDHLIIRNGKYYYCRRVPQDVAALDRRTFVRKTLKTDSETIAERRADLINAATEEYWQQLRQFGKGDDGEKYAAAVKLAQSYGFSYQPAADLALGAAGDLAARVDAAMRDKDNPARANAILGGVDRPPLTIDAAQEKFWQLTLDETRGKDERQLRKWKNPRRKAVRNFIAVIGNRNIEEITRDDALDFRAWWLDRVIGEKLTANAANKDLGHLSTLLRTVNDDLRLGLDNPFARLRLSEKNDGGDRKPFDPAYVQNTLLDPARLAGLNTQGRMILLAMADTGAGFTELTGLDPGDGEIRLDADIPFIDIKKNRHRTLKTKYRPRRIPLVGAALEAFRHCPDGFPIYLGKPDSASTTVNKFLRENGLLPSENHSAYSLRHTFEDRLTAVETPERVAADLMGHKFHRPKYGEGAELKQKKRWLDKIAFKVKAA